ncbi:acetate kinase [Pelobacter propionicus]|uniref:Acetate kinase n=1 Tax=Pelobacter propionicus (strain DSM 2379 / NBRC 103807 / OttBd1) TaxID=338966 RepID=A1ALL9_PELPD|nr:acetate kinase [Pelobacter propionicus]ABK98239.1 acetate kinase [Pelobacter propionicus DSM 2379]
MIIMALNCGSSSVKYQLYDWSRKEVVAKGIVERVTIGDSFIVHEVPGRDAFKEEQNCPTHQAAIDLIIRTVTDPKRGVIKDVSEIAAVGHRIVHGGEKFTRSVVIDDQVLEAVKECQHLAPLHNPPNIEGVLAARALLPTVPQIAVFDTAFHQTMPEYAYIYPVPYEWYQKHQVRRYGFHGTSHLYVAKRAAALLGKKPADTNLVTLHIGNGVSHCAIKNGISIDTSMGLTPLEGAIMGTRCGDIDPAIPLFMMHKEGLSVKDIDTILNKKSGILGITGRFSDRRDVARHAEAGDERCKLAMRIEVFRIKKYIGAYMAIVGKLDAVVFTAGVGEMSVKVREMVLEGMEHLGLILDRERNNSAMTRKKETLITTDDSPVKAFVIPTDEELVLTEDVAAILNGTYADHMNFEYAFSRPDFVRT